LRPAPSRFPPHGNKAVLVTLTEKNIKTAKKREGNFSGLLDGLFADWINR
jgi:hypothetical protein